MSSNGENYNLPQLTMDNTSLAIFAKQWGLADNRFFSWSELTVGENEIEPPVLEAEIKASLRQTLIDFAECRRIAYVRFAIADETASRHTYVCSRQSGELNVVAKGGMDSVITQNSQGELKMMLQRALAMEMPVSRPDIDLIVSSQAVITFLAMLDAYRYFRCQSLLAHTRPPESIRVTDILQRLNDTAEDFRWLLPFAEAAMPIRIGSTLGSTEIVVALSELAEVGLVLDSEPDAEGMLVYSLTDVGRLLCDGVLHEVSKVVLRVSEIGNDEVIGHSAQIFVRDSRFLWAFVVDGQQGYICGVGSQGFERLLDAALSFEKKPYDDKPPVFVHEEKTFCTACGREYGAGDRFCSQCGKAK